LDGSSWNDVDLSGRKVLRDIRDELDRKHIACSLCNLKYEVRDKLCLNDLADVAGAIENYSSQAAVAVAAKSTRRKSLSPAEWLARDQHLLDNPDHDTFNPMLAVERRAIDSIDQDLEGLGDGI
jgi:hypothetical protein